MPDRTTSRGLRSLALAAAMSWTACCVTGSFAVAADGTATSAASQGASNGASNGSWKFSTADQDQPELSYSENDKIMFFVGCGHAFAMWAVYPGAPKKNNAKAAITIENGKSQRNFAGQAQDDFGDRGGRPHATYFSQYDLGYDRASPGTYSEKWRAQEYRLLVFLDSGQPLTISAEGKSYVLPPIKIDGWTASFKKIC